MPILQNLKLCCGIPWSENEGGEGNGPNCGFFLKLCSYLYGMLRGLIRGVMLWLGLGCSIGFLLMGQEEQKVIEAQIRMQQQELQDEEERRLRRESLMRPSNRIATTEEVENLDLSCRSLSGLPYIYTLDLILFRSILIIYI